MKGLKRFAKGFFSSLLGAADGLGNAVSEFINPGELIPVKIPVHGGGYMIGGWLQKKQAIAEGHRICSTESGQLYIRA